MWSGQSCLLCLRWQELAGMCPLHIDTWWRHNRGRARENCNSEDQPRVESVHTRRHVVRGANDLLAQLRRSRWVVVHGLFDACGHRVSLGDP